MKNLVLGSVCSLLAFGAFGEASVNRVLVRQQWPWSREVRVDYEVSGAEGSGVDLAVEVKAGDVTLDTEAIVQATVKGGIHGVKNGYGFFSFDPQKAFGNAQSSREISVKLTVDKTADPLADRVEYRIVDLETHEQTDLRRRDFYDRPGVYGAFTTDYSTVGPGFTSSLGEGETFVWTGVNQNEYKTTKMVFKRIPAKGVVWTMGPAEGDPNAKAPGFWGHPIMGESRVEVKLTKNYFIGVFEVTQRQYELLTGGENPSFFTNASVRATWPVESVPLEHKAFVAKINALYDYGFKVPTEAQWEFAARAGYEGTGLPNGKDRTEDNFKELEAYLTRGNPNRNDTTVGLFVGVGRPNAYGLYNTLGSVSEWIAEESNTNIASYWSNKPKPVEDPVVTSNNLASNYGMLRGGSFQRLESYRYAARFATPDGQALLNGQPAWGWRLLMDAE